MASGWGRGKTLFLDGGATVDRLLPLGGSILAGLQQVTQTDCDGTSGLDCVRGEEGSSRTTREHWNGREGTDGDQNCAEGGHGLWMFGGQEFQSVGGIQEPCRHVRDGGDS